MATAEIKLKVDTREIIKLVQRTKRAVIILQKDDLIDEADIERIATRLYSKGIEMIEKGWGIWQR